MKSLLTKGINHIIKYTVFATSKLWPNRFSEFREIKRLSAHYNSPDFTVVQIGANNGILRDPIFPLIKRYGWKGVLVEPVKHHFRQLQETYRAFPSIILENCAITENQETKTMYSVNPETPLAPVWAAGLSSLYEENLLKHKKKFPDISSHIIQEEVQCMTLEHLVSKHRLKRIDLLCVDAEGYDFQILKQVHTLDVRPKVILYEHKHMDSNVKKQTKEMLQRLGYTINEKIQNTIAVAYHLKPNAPFYLIEKYLSLPV